MKHLFRNLALIAVALCTAGIVASCDDDDDYAYIDDGVINSVVTLKTNPTNGQFYMQLDDSTTLIPENITKSPYGDKETRAFMRFTMADSTRGHYSHAIRVLTLDTIRTKSMSPKVDDINKVYGKDPLEIVDDWTTVCEDGYLTLRFRTYFGGRTTHTLSLVQTNDSTVELHQDAHGDTAGEVGDGIIAFRLTGLPETNGKYKDLILKWQSFTGSKSHTFKYKSRE